ncbi:MAG TPA: VOC family protein [Gemmatimonadaceae bacterium]
MQHPPTPPAPDEPSRSSAPSHVPTGGLDGWITHTEFASADPAATREWCVKVLGWTFKPSLAGPSGEYHPFAYSDQGGGGIHRNDPSEPPGSIPFVHVADVHAAFEKALAEGAVEVTPPTRVTEVVTIGVVRAPGGVLIGFSGQ